MQSARGELSPTVLLSNGVHVSHYQPALPDAPAAIAVAQPTTQLIHPQLDLKLIQWGYLCLVL
jgi:hypothetical protein